MPSLLTPISASKQPYSPLADETDQTHLNAAPGVLTENGAIVYSKQINPLRSESEETLSPSTLKGMDGPLTEEDIGELPRIRSKDKGKQRAWDLEQGRVDIERAASSDSYPPINEGDDEERKIQENLARFAARDMARRRAARLSRQLPASPAIGSSSTTSYMRRPLSLLSTTSSKEVRSSSNAQLRPQVQEQEVPASPSTSRYNNPYDVQPDSPTRKMTIQQPNASPFDDPVPHPQPVPKSRHGYTQSQDSIPDNSAGGDPYGYAGPSWRGGAGAGPPRNRGGEKWWHALCAWGSDLDDQDEEGRDGQAGRTNPFE